MASDTDRAIDRFDGSVSKQRKLCENYTISAQDNRFFSTQFTVDVLPSRR
jgi:hypothetical protein